MLKKSLYLCSTLVFAALAARGFVLLGPGAAEGNLPAKQWQTRGANPGGWSIGYGFPGDIGAPVDPIEAYRWNVPTITYAYEDSFVRFFGTNGMRAMDEAFRILNDLPPASKMSDDLSEFPLSTARANFEAAQFSLVDIKSAAMPLILEELGVAQADRWVWSLHHREPLPGPGNPATFDVIRYNIDPVTLQRTPYINETLYTYFVEQFPPPGAQTPYAITIPQAVPAGVIPNSPVSSFGSFTPGVFYTGLTRDDVGALRYLWNPRNIVAETLLAGTTPGIGGWNPFLGTNFLGSNFFNTNVVGTNNAVTAGLRGGQNKVTFRKVYFDSLLGGTFTPITNAYKDTVIVPATGRAVSQTVLRPIVLPDFIFTVEDLGPLAPFLRRTDTSGWLNNDALTPNSNLGGPGVIVPPITITFNLIFPVFFNQAPDFVTEPTGSLFAFDRGFTWATFDGTTNAPIVYPEYLHTTFNNLKASARAAGGF